MSRSAKLFEEFKEAQEKRLSDPKVKAEIEKVKKEAEEKRT